MNADGTDLRQLAPHVAAPIWSPRGRTIAFSVGGDHIQLIEADGTDRRAFATGTEVAWSPDGSRIAFVGELVPPKRDPWPVLNVVDLRKKQVRTIVAGRYGSKVEEINFDTDVYGGGALFPSWSPDGNVIVFTPATEDPGNHYGLSADRALFKVNADGSGLKRLTNHAYHASFMRDGRILFMRDDRIWIRNADGSEIPAVAN